MNTVRIDVTATKLPPGGEIQLWSAFDPSFWMNQKEIEHLVIDEDTAEDVRFGSFRSTDQVYVMARCKAGFSCKDFEIKYQRVHMPNTPPDGP